MKLMPETLDWKFVKKSKIAFSFQEKFEKNITKLSLGYLGLTILPDKVMEDFPKVQKLDLKCNKLSFIPEKITKLKNLKVLNLTNNPLNGSIYAIPLSLLERDVFIYVIGNDKYSTEIEKSKKIASLYEAKVFKAGFIAWCMENY
jgi:hypothetical protein